MSNLEPGPMTKTHHLSPIEALKASVAERLENYIEVMDGRKAVDLATVAQQQTNLWRLIQFVLSKREQEFIQAFTVLLNRIDSERTRETRPETAAFSSSRILRGQAQMNIGDKERKMFGRIMHLLVSTASVKSRAVALRQIDLRASLSLFPGETQEKIKAYYELL